MLLVSGWCRSATIPSFGVGLDPENPDISNDPEFKTVNRGYQLRQRWSPDRRPQYRHGGSLKLEPCGNWEQRSLGLNMLSRVEHVERPT